MSDPVNGGQGNSFAQGCLGLGCIVLVIIAVIYVVMAACAPGSPSRNEDKNDSYCPGGVTPRTVYDPNTDKIVLYCP